jgi:hypothetical protein
MKFFWNLKRTERVSEQNGYQNDKSITTRDRNGISKQGKSLEEPQGTTNTCQNDIIAV